MTLKTKNPPASSLGIKKKAQQLGLISLVCSGLLTPTGNQSSIMSLILANSALAQEIQNQENVEAGENSKLENAPKGIDSEEFIVGFKDRDIKNQASPKSEPLITKPVAFGILGVSTLAAAVWCKMNIKSCKSGAKAVKDKLLGLTNKAGDELDQLNAIKMNNLDVDWDNLTAFNPKISKSSPLEDVLKVVDEFKAEQKAYKLQLQQAKNYIKSSEFNSRVEILDGFELDTSMTGLKDDLIASARRLKSDGIFAVFGKQGSGKSHHVKAMAKRAAETADPDRPIYVRLNNNSFDQAKDAKYVSVIKNRFTDVFELAYGKNFEDLNIIFVVDDYKYLDRISLGDGQTLLPAFDEIVKSNRYKILMTGKLEELDETKKAFSIANPLIKKEPEWANIKNKHLSEDATKILFDFLDTKAPDNTKFIKFADEGALKTFFDRSDTYFNNMTEPGRSLFAAKEVLGAHVNKISELCTAKDLCNEIDTLKELGRRLDELDLVLADHGKAFDADAVFATKSEIDDVLREASDIKAKLSSKGISVDMTASDVDEAFVKAMGFNKKLLSEETRASEFAKLKEELESSVLGQQFAIKSIIETLESTYRNFANGKLDGVASVQFFSGQSGVGKTYMAKMINKFLLGGSDDIDKLASVTVTEGMRSSDFFEALVSSIKQNPNSVILIDEIDKSPNIPNLLNEVLNDGIIRFNGETLDIRTKHVIINSNAGFQDAGAGAQMIYSFTEFKHSIAKAAEDYIRGGKTAELAEAYERAVTEANIAGNKFLWQYFPNAFITRVSPVNFRPIDVDGRAKLASEKILGKIEQYSSRSDSQLLTNVNTSITEEALENAALFTFYDEAGGSVRYFNKLLPAKIGAALSEAKSKIEEAKRLYGHADVTLDMQIVEVFGERKLEVKFLVDTLDALPPKKGSQKLLPPSKTIPFDDGI